VYGATATGPEDGPTRPVSPYGVTKLAAEHLLGAHHRTFGFPAVVLRYFSVYGPRQRPDMAYRIFGERLLRGEPITVHGDGRQTRANTYVSDCVAATVAAVERGEPGDVLNIGGGKPVALLDAVTLLAGALGVEARIEHAPARAGDQRDTEADSSAAALALGWKPAIEPEEGLGRFADWLRDRAATG
jgi:nucleoside-diphosphate-sugar epimerase